MTESAAEKVFEGTRSGSLAERLRGSPLFMLLAYVRPHARPAAFTFAFGVVGFALSFAYPWIIGAVVDLATDPSPIGAREARLVTLTEFAAVAAVLHSVVVYGRGHMNVRLGDGVVTDLRRHVFSHVQSLSLRFFAHQRTGAIVGRVLDDVREAAQVLYAGLIVVALDIVQVAIALALLCALSVKLTLGCILVFPAYALVFAGMNPRVRRASERLRAHVAYVAGTVNEQLAGQAVVKTFSAERRESERFARSASEQHALVLEQSHEGHLVAGAGELFVHAGTTVVVGYGGLLALRGEITAGEMTRFLGYMILMYGPVRRFAELNIVYQSSLSALRRVFRVLAIRPAVAERPGACALPPSRGHLRMVGVHFRYAEDSDETRYDLERDEPRARTGRSGHWVLRDLDLEARPGERIAVVGRSGAGKSTLMALVPRLYDATAGHVIIDGVDVRDYALSALRGAIAVVHQDPFLFTGTIRDNIAYGRPDASDAAIERAARGAYAHEFIASLPMGYASRLGERGLTLSGGQRQRISIARALLTDPAILILDEATSALDSESESLVQRALEALMASRTCLVIAHRLSTIRNADRIYVVEEGRLEETGTHVELVARGGLYAQLVSNQTRIV